MRGILRNHRGKTLKNHLSFFIALLAFLTCTFLAHQNIYAASNDTQKPEEDRSKFSQDTLIRFCNQNQNCSNFTKQNSLSYWEKTRDGFFGFIENNVRPGLKKAYQGYINGVGKNAGDLFWIPYDWVSPRASEIFQNTKAYWFHQSPTLKDKMEHLPSSVKVLHEKFVDGLWSIIYHMTKRLSIKSIDDYGSTFFEAYKARNGLLKIDTQEQARLENLLNSLRPYGLDKDLRNCYRIYAVPSKTINAFSSTCNIYVYSGLSDILSDDELRAVISHEMAHGINGDSLKLSYTIAKSVLYHFSKLGIEEALWFLTDEDMEYFNETIVEGTPTMIGIRANKSNKTMEIRADLDGVEVLNRAGFSGVAAIQALKTAGGYETLGDLLDERDNPYDTHPITKERVQAIHDHMRF